ncbi:MAG: type II toxin-antitoxin system VapC family toxin [Thiohalobacteraceae bacterium]|nr:type II toxin-antitoxin system VapC family toxin [Gammaproteobacteria bacterium]
MRFLLDTHVLLWAVGDSGRLPETTRNWLEDGNNEVFFSAASLWEIAIKASLGREDFQIDPGQILEAMPETGFTELPIRARHAVEVSRLPPIHKDPFDRLLVAQSRVEPMLLLTNDELLAEYTDNVRLLR